MLRSHQSGMKKNEQEEEADDSLYDEFNIQWSDLIFLPFNRIFKLIVLICVIHQIVLGPLDAVFGFTSDCSDILDHHIVTVISKYIYKYAAGIIYFIDTLLHILHRQVTDKAVRREHLPKSAFLIILDVLSVIPFFDFLVEEPCVMNFYPNILCFIQFLIVYRIVEYFELKSTHICWKQYIGYTIFVLSFVNCITCFLLLLTYSGLCAHCPYRRQYFLDWRKYVLYKNENNTGKLTWYYYGFQYILSFIINFVYEETKPSAMLEYLLASAFMIIGYLFDICVVFPKLFAESTLALRRICTFHPHVQKLIHETKRRNPSPKAHESVKSFYTLMWKKRSGITAVPEIMNELPRYLRVDIREDLVWPVFYHSPTLRKTSTAFKRYLCDFIRYDFKLPGEKLFAGPRCHTNLYYLKSGIVQLLSVDDGITSLMSVTCGTLFGDISFYSPPLKRKISVKCLTYCEILYISRVDLLKCLLRYPNDRKHAFEQANSKMRHAKTLYSCKKNIKGLDRAEDEGMDWLKRRWWEISYCVDKFKHRSTTIDRCQIPPEETVYHCAKYIGQLVLSTEAQLKQSSLFINDKFPWVLAPNSIFNRVWHNFVIATVIAVLFYFPPNISRKEISSTFLTFKYFADFVYIADICVSLFTSVEAKEFATLNFSSVMLVRFKRPTFVMDILAALWIEHLIVIIGKPEYYHVCLFNRLLKIYMLFPSEGRNWKVGQDHMLPVYIRVFFCSFTYMYVSAFTVFVFIQYIPGLSATYFYGNTVRGHTNLSQTECALKRLNSVLVPLDFVFEYLYCESHPRTMIDIAFKMFISYHGYIIFNYCQARFIAGRYLKFRDIINYQRFVSTLRNYYRRQKIRKDLMVRLDRYLNIHWKYHHGVDVMHPNSLKSEPYDIFWKVQGEVAEKLISESAVFEGADPVLIREMAYAAKFIIIPKDAIVFLFGVTCKYVTWIVQGQVKCEYNNEEGEILHKIYGPGEILSLTSVLFEKSSFQSYFSYTDCEILYITIKDFHNIMRDHPHEWNCLCASKEEFKSSFQTIINKYVKQHAEYHRKFRERLFHAKPSKIKKIQKKEKSDDQKRNSGDFVLQNIDCYVNPESRFIRYWMPFRALTVLISIVASSLQGGGGARFTMHLNIIHDLCNIVALFDIIMKLFLAYYDEQGILITAKLKTMTHYLSRGFLMDVIGALPWETILTLIMEEEISHGSLKLINTAMKFAHAYILTGYLDYLADRPSVISVLIKILKWQLLAILAILAGSHFLVHFCVAFHFDDDGYLANMTRLKSCWMPKYIELNDDLSIDQLHMIFVQSLNMAQSGLWNVNYGKFRVTEKGYVVVGFTLFLLGVINWYVVSYCVTMLVLVSRSDTLFQHSYEQLRKFLRAERVETKLIEDTMAHFSYWWKRSKGINIHTLMFERMGVVLRQDLSYFFFENTFTALDTLLGGGEQFERQMASLSSEMYFLPNEQIMREMDLLPSIFIVHRGRVIIMQNDEKIAVLTKGSIFGQLTGAMPRPVKSTAIADGYTDVLYMSIREFDEVLTEDVREHIFHNPQSKNDFMSTKKVFRESPDNTIKYILKGRKTIRLPWMVIPKEALTRSWYTKWLYLVWLFCPAATAYITAILITLPNDAGNIVIWCLTIFDLFHLMHTVSEYFTIEVAVVGDRCVNRIVGWRLFKDWRLYINIFSLVVPMITFLTDDWVYLLARLPRLLLFIDFHKHFCRSFKSKMAPFLLNFIILTLMLHCMTCGWIYFACRGEVFPVPLPPLPDKVNRTVDYSEWVIADQRKGGCARITRNFVQADGEGAVSFVVPKRWVNDYIVAITFIILLHTHNVLDTVMQLTIAQAYYKVFITVIIYLIDIWLMSHAMGFIYTKYRELYQYDYNVRNLNIYLQHSGLAPSLLRAVVEYTKHLWNRQKGNWMPELAMQAPTCLREDLYVALYMHHILTPPLFRQLPVYFTRQLVARAQRSVIFPGKCLVQEGDINSVIYFIHEGEIEKWYNYLSPERKMSALLTTNGYFGIIPGLFPNTRFQYTYVSRTVVYTANFSEGYRSSRLALTPRMGSRQVYSYNVVDIISLRLRDWQDLLTAYPDIKVKLYEGAKKLKAEFKKEGIYL